MDRETLEIAAEFRQRVRVLSDASWRLDSAISMVAKAKHGYRSNPLLGDAAWDATGYERTLADVLAYAKGLSHQLAILLERNDDASPQPTTGGTDVPPPGPAISGPAAGSRPEGQ
jgi:hypothetical protein